jgi:hypothetical protein
MGYCSCWMMLQASLVIVSSVSAPFDQRQVWRNVSAVDVEHDRDVEAPEGAGHGIALCEPGIIGGVGAADQQRVGALKPAGQSHPPQIASDVQGVILEVGSSSQRSNAPERWCVAAPWVTVAPAGWATTSSHARSGSGTR